MRTLYLYILRIHGQPRTISEWFDDPLVVGGTYNGPAGRHAWCTFDVVGLAEVIAA